MSASEVVEQAEPVAEPSVAPRRRRLRMPGIPRRVGRVRPVRPGPAMALLVILATGTSAVWSHVRTVAEQNAPSARNAALTDVTATAEVKNRMAQAVDAVFSFDFTDPAKTDAAVSADLVGAAVGQYAALMSPVRAHADSLKLVLTTTVTSAGVQSLRGDRARVLVFADQTDTGTAGTSESAVALSVDAVRSGGVWRIAGIETVGAS